MDLTQDLLVDALGATVTVALQQGLDISGALAVDEVGLVAVRVRQLDHVVLVADAHHGRVEEHRGPHFEAGGERLLGSVHGSRLDISAQSHRLREGAVLVDTGERRREQRAEVVVAQGQVFNAELVDERGLARGGGPVEQEEGTHDGLLDV